MKTSVIKYFLVLAGILLSAYSKAQISNDYDGTSCPPVTVNFTPPIFAFIDTGDIYQWWFNGDGPYYGGFWPDSIVDPFPHTFTQGGWYQVMIEVIDSLGNPTANTVSGDIEIAGASFNISVDTACPGDEIYFNLQTQGNVDDDQIFWDFGDGNTAYGWNVNHAYSVLDTFTVTLIVDAGCGIDTITKSIYIGNTVAPVANINIWPDPVCPNDYVNFSTWGAAGSFYWTFGDGSDTTLTDPGLQHAYNTVGTKTVTMTITNGCGLSDSTTASVSVQNGLAFTETVDFNVSPDSACPGDAVSFDCWDCDQYAAFSWDFGDGSPFETNDTRPSHSYATTGIKIITLTVLNGCGNAGTFTNTIVIANNVTPDINQYGDGYGVVPPMACPNDPIIFFDGTLTSGFWDFGDGDTASSIYGTFGAGFSVITHAYTDTGTYTGTFTITNGCGNSATDTFSVTIGDSVLIMILPGNNGPGNIEWSTKEENNGVITPSPVCEEIGFAALGGGNNFSWDWGDGDTTVTNTPGTTHAYNTTGTYTISVFVQNSCGDTATFTDSITISGVCASLSVSASGSDPTCKSIADGSATAAASGGTQPYTYLWDDPAGQTTETATGLSGGTYTVIVTDASGDNATASVTLTPQFTLSILIDPIINASCGGSDGVATATVTGGTPTYSYNWSNGATTAVNVALSAGFYIVTVTDANGCSDFALATISDNDGPIVTVTSTTDADCNGSGGAINIFISQGTTPYTYLWSNGSVTKDISNLSAGPYEIYVTDANGCVGLKSVMVAGQGAFSLTTTTTDATCGNPDGSATVIVSGGASPFTYSWSGGGTDSTKSNIAAGVYNVTVIDANGCVGSATATVSEIGGAAITIDSIINEVCNGAGGSVYISVTGGATPYTFLWSNSDTTEDIIGLSAGTYDVTVTGSNGCIATAITEIIMTPPSTEPICLVTVDSATGKNLVVWEKLQIQGIQSYNIYKESTQSDIYYLIDSVLATGLSQYSDTLSDPFIRSWRYKISAVDSCGNESALSAEHKTMHLTVNLGIPPAINLIWDHYQGFTFSTYDIYRYTDSTGWDTLTSIQNNLTSATDPSPPPGDVFYQVVAQHPNVCEATKKVLTYNSAKSNVSNRIIPTGIDEFQVQSLRFKVYPNPYSGETQISYTLTEKNQVSLVVYNVLGKKIKTIVNGSQNTGKYDYRFNASEANHSSGIFILQLIVNDKVYTKRLVNL